MIIEYEDINGNQFSSDIENIKQIKYHATGNITVYMNDDVSEGVLIMNGYNIYVKNIESWYRDGVE
jgi:hypothetical protein